MPKVPDMSAAAVKSREAMTKLAKANKPKEAPPAPPKHVHQMVIRNSTARPSL